MSRSSQEGARPQEYNARRLRLADGRTLSYCVYGPEDGRRSCSSTACPALCSWLRTGCAR